jgi:hypothetical protein
MASASITGFLVYKAQDLAVRGELYESPFVGRMFTFSIAEPYKSDPRNPYREEIAREEALAHH